MGEEIVGNIRLVPIKPHDVTVEQRPLFDEFQQKLGSLLHGFTTQTGDGAYIGPFNAWLQFPQYGRPIWDLFVALSTDTVLPKNVREVVILSTGATYGSLYELYSHGIVAEQVGLEQSKIATLSAGERPADLTSEEGIAYDYAAVLNRTHQIPDTTWAAAVDAFGLQGAGELAYLVTCYATVSTLLNAFDVDLPRTELG